LADGEAGVWGQGSGALVPDPRPLIPVVVGPTASGKSALVTALAALVDVEIISADSRQVYRGLDIGTAKPSAAECAAVVHHGLDLVEPSERYSAGRFAREAVAWIAGIRAHGRLPVVVGGTGLYLRALFDGLFAEPPLEAGRRARLRAALERLPAAEQTRWAQRLDQGYHGGGAQRAVRALEVALLAGAALSRLQRESASAPSPDRPWYVRLALPREVLRRRIAARVEAMLDAGFVDEVRHVLARGVAPDAPGLSGVGYAEVVRYLRGHLAGDALAAAITTSTARYAKRQETWFRRQLAGPVMVLDASADAATLAKAVLGGYRATGTK